jgi:hypothetical protein
MSPPSPSGRHQLMSAVESTLPRTRTAEKGEKKPLNWSAEDVSSAIIAFMHECVLV